MLCSRLAMACNGTVELMLLILVVLTVGRVATAPVVVKEVWLP